MKLRPFQEDMLGRTRAALRDGKRRPLMVAPTGSGKGTIIAHIIRSVENRGKRAVFLVNRRELVKDMSRRLDGLGLDHGIVMADHWRKRPWLNVHIASIDTLQRRATVPEADLVVVDEAHFAVSPGWVNVLERYPQAVVLGATATPIRLDGQGLGHIFDCMVEGPSVAELTDAGYLVPTRVYAPPPPEELRHRGKGDFTDREMAVLDKPTITGDIVAHWLRHGRGRPTVLFACTVIHSQHLCEQFQTAGVRAVHVDADTADEARDTTWADLGAYRTEVVCSVGIVSYGWDCPPVSCMILARPTESLALHLQQCGRGLRPSKDKGNLLILDHVGNTHRHGFVDDPRGWSLSDGLVLGRGGKDDPALSVRMCRSCWLAFSSKLMQCPACGWSYMPDPREIRQKEGELQEVEPERWYRCACGHKGRLPQGAAIEAHPCPRCLSGPLKSLASRYDSGDDSKRRAKYLEWVNEARERGYKSGYASVKYRRLFGSWPRKEWAKETTQEMTA